MRLSLWVSTVLGLGGILVSAGIISIEVNPKEIDSFNTNVKTFSVNCTYEHDPNNPDDADLISLVLSRLPVTGQMSAHELASIHDTSLLHILDSDPSQSVQFTGIIAEKRSSPSYLTGTWSQISEDLVGTYVCVANLIDKVGHVMVVSKQAVVLEETNSLRTFLEEVRVMQSELDSHQACCINMSAQIAELQSWRKTMALSLAFLEKNVLMTPPSEAYQNRTYFVSTYKVDNAMAAEAVCQTMGGYLAEVNDEEEWKFVQSVLDNSTLAFAFIAGRDDLTEGHWYWPRNQQPVNFTDWLPGQPSGISIENCVEALKIVNKWHWNDISCHARQRDGFICEIPDS